jgi:hypothetical protein
MDMQLRIAMLAAALGLFSAAVAAAVTTTFESCSDTAGNAVAVVADETSAKIVASDGDDSGPTIRYNPTLLPRLKPLTRLFFFAHECARHAMGDIAKPTHSVARARQADCLGLATLLKEGLIRREQLSDLQADLEFSETEWALLPGLPRQFNLDACPAEGVVRLPAQALPVEVRTPWNACVRACADRLWQCQKKCRGESCTAGCMETHQQCESACPPVPPIDHNR